MGVYTGVTKSRETINNLETTTVKFSAFAVADLPDAANWTNTVVFVSDGAAGNPILAFSNGTDWLRCDTGLAVAAA
jgi:hypothetical protein